MKGRIRTTRQARQARAEALADLRLRRAVRDGELTAYERTRTLPSGGTWQRRCENTPPPRGGPPMTQTNEPTYAFTELARHLIERGLCALRVHPDETLTSYELNALDSLIDSMRRK